MISKIVKDSLCTGCGTCVSICPQNAIRLIKDDNCGVYIPEINENDCNKCKLCLKVCPGKETNYNDLNTDLFGKLPSNKYIGNYTNCYSGFSINNDIRYNSSSGGLVTQILIFALESNIIDGVLVTRMKKDRPLEPEPFIARSKEEIIEASTSKYCPVPVNICIKKILENNIRCAVVGLPCHISGIRNTEKINKKLESLVVLHIGLFCAYGINFIGTETLIQWMNINKKNINELSYRGSGWPGAMTIKYNINQTKSCPSPIYYGRFFLDYAFAPKRCLLCNDLTCELSDISSGDAWLPEYSDDKCGTSIFIARNEIGNNLLKSANSANVISLKEIPIEKVIQSQKNPLYFKKKNVGVRAKIMGKNIDNNSIDADFADFIIAYYLYLNRYIHTLPLYRKLLLNGIFYRFVEYIKFVFNFMYSKKANKLAQRENYD